MLELIRSVPGPLFLLLYMSVVALGLVFGGKWIDSDGSEGHPMPDFARFDPVSLALLRGGMNEVIRTVVFKLMDLKLVEIKSMDKKTFLDGVGRHGKKLTAVEYEIHRYIKQNTPYPADLFKSAGLKQLLETHLSGVRQEFIGSRLIRSSEEQVKIKAKKLSIIILVLALGLIKLYLGITRDRPVAFLIILIGIAFILLVAFPKTGALSALGKRYLAGVQKHFEWIKDEIAQEKRPKGIDPAMAVALFGTASLLGFGHHQAYAKAFPAKNNSSGGCGGSGCGGSAGCGGSSGCGGGGGCGGCGGGGD